MNFGNALRMLRDGTGMKPSGWRGYVKREDVDTCTGRDGVRVKIPEYDPSASYVAGDSVVHNGVRFWCTGDTSGQFDAGKWTVIQFDYYITFVGAEDGKRDDSPGYSSRYLVEVTPEGVTYRDCGPECPTCMFGAGLLSGVACDSWEIYQVADLEAVRNPAPGSVW